MSDSGDGNRPVEISIHPARKARPPGQPVPAGKIEMVVTYLEMTAPPRRPPVSRPAAQHAIMRAQPPTVSFYRYLYNTVGARWLWFERRRMTDETLLEILEHSDVEIFVLYVRGSPAGFVELDRRVESECQIAYLGLFPDFMGQRIGRYLLDWAIDAAWRSGPERIWVHTCNFDHPRAFGLYQRAGFVPYDQETLIIDDPRLDGTF